MDAELSEMVDCPYCGEAVELFVERDVEGELEQDCWVCCNPWRVRIRRDGEDRRLEVSRLDE